MQRDGRQLAVFSHPNHELAVFGFVQRFRPTLLFLTDGGGERRVAETRAGLASIGAAGRARFLGHSEAALYDALLHRDVAFCRSLAGEIAAAIDALQPDSIHCDAVEFYNPVHDLTLPLVLAALALDTATRLVYEMPLIYQRAGDAEAYAIQRLPPSQQAQRIELRLRDDELAAKRQALADGYGQLKAQLDAIQDLPDSHIACEEMRQFTGALPRPDGERVVRYEWRGRLLRDRGLVEQVITYADHYRPLAAALGAR